MVNLERKQKMMQRMRRLLWVLLVGCWLGSAWGAAPWKNIIVMIPDGTGYASLTVARQLKGASLAIDAVLCGSVQTSSASHFVTDSAAAGTAMSCGERTVNGSIGVDAQKVPLTTFGEWARAQGKAVGIVTTDEITGATPAAFSAHVANRKEAKAIFEQQLTSGFEFFCGGGRALLTEEMAALLKEEGYTLATDADALKQAQGKVFGLFAPGILTAEVERKGGAPCDEPRLPEMAEKALAELSKDPDGFFLMIEGAQVDKANHAHDLPWATYELLAFDETVGLVLAWAEAQGDTLVVVAPDHETGGLSLLDDPPATSRVARLKDAALLAKRPGTAQEYNVHYASTWHTGVDVFLASNDLSVRPALNKDFRRAITGEGSQPLAPLTGETIEREGVPYLVTPEGKELRAQRDAIYLPATQQWYAR